MQSASFIFTLETFEISSALNVARLVNQFHWRISRTTFHLFTWCLLLIYEAQLTSVSKDTSQTRFTLHTQAYPPEPTWSTLSVTDVSCVTRTISHLWLEELSPECIHLRFHSLHYQARRWFVGWFIHRLQASISSWLRLGKCNVGWRSTGKLHKCTSLAAQARGNNG